MSSSGGLGGPDSLVGASAGLLSSVPGRSTNDAWGQDEGFKKANTNIQPFFRTVQSAQVPIHPIDHNNSSGVQAATHGLLPVVGLLNCNTMVPDSRKPTGYSDLVSALANQDFHDIVCFYMDADIHNTFVSATPTTLETSVEAIATDSPDNETFYKTLQVPYVVSSLGRSTMDEGKQCNSIRAEAKLKDLSTQSDVYKRHIDALYRFRFLQKFPTVQPYLDDQAGKTGNDYTANIQAIGKALQQKIKADSEGVNGTDDTTAKANLDAALADIDSLTTWATTKKLYYAYSLYYWSVSSYIPQLYAQTINGSMSASVSRTIKKMTNMFGILESGQQNPNGKSFQEAFNNLIQVLLMQSVIRQLVDLDSTTEDIDSVMQDMQQQFSKDYLSSSDPDISAEAARAQQLAWDNNLRKSLFNNLAASMRLTGPLGSWSAIVQGFENLNSTAVWFQKLANGADIAATFMRAICVTLLVLPMISKSSGGWRELSTEQKTTWIATCSALGVTFLVKGLQGSLRMVYFWQDLGSFTFVCKAFFGFQSVLADLRAAAEATENTFARWFVRTGPETMELTGNGMTASMTIFGRSAGQFLTSCVGSILAGVNITLSIIDAIKSTDPLQKAMDNVMLVSSGLQLLALGAGWLVSADTVVDETAVAILETVAPCAGPHTIVFAVTGLVVMIGMECLPKDPPNPLRNCVDEHAAPAGLKMDYDTAIDYFNVVPASDSAASLNGISFSATVNATSGVLQLGSVSSGSEYAIKTSSVVTHLPDTCWNVQTDSNGNTTVFTFVTDDQNLQTSICLTEMDDGSVLHIPPPSKTTTDGSGKVVPTDPGVYAAAIARQQWSINALESAQTQQRTNGSNVTIYTVSGTFSITRPNNKTLYLVPSGVGLQVQLATSAPANSTSSWTLTLQSMAPYTFSYLVSNWILDTGSTGLHNDIAFMVPTSLPLTWTVSPDLPTSLALVDSGIMQGSIKQVSGSVPQVMGATSYNVTATIIIEGQVFSKTASVTISVIDPSSEVSDNAVS